MSTKERKHPCDQCRRRKVRCNYALPCDRCTSHNLPCAFNTIRKRRGPKPGTGSVIETLRAGSYDSTLHNNSQDLVLPPIGTIAYDRDTSQSGYAFSDNHQPIQSHHTPSNVWINQASPQSHVQGEQTQPVRENLDSDSQFSPNSFIDDAFFTFDEFAQTILCSSMPWQGQRLTDGQPISSIRQDRYSIAALNEISATPEHITEHDSEIIEHGIDLFFEHMYTVYPVVDSKHVRSLLIDTQEESPQAKSRLLWSICALTLMSVDAWPNMNTDLRTHAARRYIRRCLESRISSDYIENATVEDVLTSLFISVTYFDLKCRKNAWFYVREAITLAQAAGMHNIDRRSKLDPTERIRRQRIYALLYITERGACIHDTFPISILSPPTLLCERLSDEDPAASVGLSMLFYLFSLLDLNFVRFWSSTSLSDSTEKEYVEVAVLQEQLRCVLDLTGVSEVQRADILITQQWLRLMVWQTALRLGMISSAATDPSYSYAYPIQIAVSLCDALKTLSQAAIEVHGLGIFEKQFEIAYSLLDALTLSDATQSPNHHDTLRSLLQSLSASPKSRDVYVRILQKKMGHGSSRKTDPRYVHLAGVQLLVDDRQKSRQQSMAVARERTG